MLSNNVQKGVLRTEENKNPKNGEEKVYHKLFLEADDNLHFVYGLPQAGWYMFTESEIRRNFNEPVNVSTFKGFQTGLLHLFILGKACAITRVQLDENEYKTVRLSLSLLRRARERADKNVEDKVKPGILDVLNMF